MMSSGVGGEHKMQIGIVDYQSILTFVFLHGCHTIKQFIKNDYPRNSISVVTPFSKLYSVKIELNIS